MALPGLLIEYFISGTVALLWIVPLTGLIEVDLQQSVPLPLLAVVLYVIGMFVDFLAFWMVMPLKKWNRKRTWQRYGKSDVPEKSQQREVLLLIHAPEIAKEAVMRSSRDRIARGVSANVLIAVVVFAFTGQSPIVLALLLALLVLSLLMWWVFQRLTDTFEIVAVQQVRARQEASQRQ